MFQIKQLAAQARMGGIDITGAFSNTYHAIHDGAFDPSLKKLFSRKNIQDWAHDKLAVLRKDLPLVRVLMHPAAEDNPYLVVLKEQMERHGAKVTMIDNLEKSELLRLAPLYDVLHIFNIMEYHSPFASSDALKQITRFGRRFANLWMTKRMGLKLFWTLYNDPKGDYSSEKLEMIGRKMMFRQADRIICPSRATARLLRERYPDLPEHKVAHIPHHNFGDYYPKMVERRIARRHLGITCRGRVYVCFGGIHPYKGISDIIPLFGRHPMKDHTLLVAGTPSNENYADTIRGLCERYDNVHAFIKNIARDEVQYYLQAADIFVMPYKDVLNSGSLMLAMRFGKPLVAPRVGSIPEVVNQVCAVLFEQAGSHELKKALIQSLDMNIEKAAQEARRISESYSAERLSRRMINTYLDFFPRRRKIPEEAEEL